MYVEVYFQISSVKMIFIFLSNVQLGLIFRQYMLPNSRQTLVTNQKEPQNYFGFDFLFLFIPFWIGVNFGTIHPSENIYKTDLTASKLTEQPEPHCKTDKEEPNLQAQRPRARESDVGV